MVDQHIDSAECVKRKSRKHSDVLCRRDVELPVLDDAAIILERLCQRDEATTCPLSARWLPSRANAPAYCGSIFAALTIRAYFCISLLK